MYLKIFLLFIMIFGIDADLLAQVVKRKGVTVNQAKNKVPEAQFTLSQLEGKWQEVKRNTAAKKDSDEFTDSLLLHFINEKVEVRYATSMLMSMNGSAQIIAPNTLAAAGDEYTILSLNSNKLVVDDGEFIREFQKKDQFYFETAVKLKEQSDSVSNPVSIDINQLKGKWNVYARKALPGATDKQTAIIKSLEIVSISDDGIAFGQVVFYSLDISKTLPCQMVTKDGVIKIITEKDTWNFYAYKADGKEFIFGETGKLVYYSKP